ncbi:MAG: hypothetical protein RMN25_08610 [Anaerolineae bacterium]|nr:hypothetical protein [Thermoflexales bacterium]MDW8407834.1 hypothetical protein [Anaerolineae bacterium]
MNIRRSTALLAIFAGVPVLITVSALAYAAGVQQGQFVDPVSDRVAPGMSAPLPSRVSYA